MDTPNGTMRGKREASHHVLRASMLALPCIAGLVLAGCAGPGAGTASSGVLPAGSPGLAAGARRAHHDDLEHPDPEANPRRRQPPSALRLAVDAVRDYLACAKQRVWPVVPPRPQKTGPDRRFERLRGDLDRYRLLHPVRFKARQLHRRDDDVRRRPQQHGESDRLGAVAKSIVPVDRRRGESQRSHDLAVRRACELFVPGGDRGVDVHYIVRRVQSIRVHRRCRNRYRRLRSMPSTSTAISCSGQVLRRLWPLVPGFTYATKGNTISVTPPLITTALILYAYRNVARVLGGRRGLPVCRGDRVRLTRCHLEWRQ